MSADIENICTYINRAISRELAEKIIDDIEFKLEPSMIPHHTDIIGEIAIVTRRE